jgi:3-oxochol-4-en-24-oyl-CoA dehydrogenase
MTIGVTEEHTALAEMTRRWSQRHAPVSVARAVAEGGAEPPETWPALIEQGLAAVHLPAEQGGGGAGPAELAIVAEELGRALAVAPFLPVAMVTTVLALAGGHDDRLRALAGGASLAGVEVGRTALRCRGQDGTVRIWGSAGHVLGGHDADVLLLSARDDDDRVRWFLVAADDTAVHRMENLDAARPVARVELDVAVPDTCVVDVAPQAVDDVRVTLAAAEAAGIAGWCLDTAVEYAKVREQFGRPIGQFQAVKHLCADMLTATEQARAAAWDAARALGDSEQRPLAAAVAGAVALEAAVDAAKTCIQVLGGIGFTWEHDAHLYLRRAVALRQLLGPTSRWRAAAARHALGGARRTLSVDLDAAGTAALRHEIRRLLRDLPDEEPARRHAIADAGLIQPHWPAPWGRGAGPQEQLLIDSELAAADVQRPDLVIGGWVLPTIIGYGTPEQQERFVRPTLHGDIVWCQLFSEPGAGSDLAALQTKATRTEGGWLLSGQKVWTSVAHKADWGLCLARTDPSAEKHQGITCFVVDMKAAGVDIRPLREITGQAMFNEVFLNDVFVPDDQVVGAPGDGWRAGRTTLANERVAMSSGSTMGVGVEGVLATVGAQDDPDHATLERVGALVCEGQVLSVLGLRTTLRRLGGLEPGAGSSVRKLVGMHHAQSCAEYLLELQGPDGATLEGVAGRIGSGFLQSRCLTIAGGTTEVQRNVVAERILGLPRDDAS